MAVKEAISRLREYLNTQKADAVILNRRSSFAWFSGGESSMNFYTDMGLGFIWVTANDAFCCASNNEVPRIRKEIFGDSFPVKEFSWVEGPGPNLAKLIAGKKVKSDFPLAGAEEDFGGIKKLRYALFPGQIETARALGKESSLLLEQTLEALPRGLPENRIQAEIRYAFEKQGIDLPVLLIAGDENLNQYRHPLATSSPANERVMAVLCPRRRGVVTAVSRILYFRKPSPLEIAKNEAVARISCSLMAASREGVSAASLWDIMLKAYKENGFPGEYTFHHQGGAVGFESREWILRPALNEAIIGGQMVAWNPTIAGAKSEETILTGSGLPEILTLSGNWPTLKHEGIEAALPFIK